MMRIDQFEKYEFCTGNLILDVGPTPIFPASRISDSFNERHDWIVFKKRGFKGIS
jgi:hypothetical protein